LLFHFEILKKSLKKQFKVNQIYYNSINWLPFINFHLSISIKWNDKKNKLNKSICNKYWKQKENRSMKGKLEKNVWTM
jgi:hypothetical protein